MKVADNSGGMDLIRAINAANWVYNDILLFDRAAVVNMSFAIPDSSHTWDVFDTAVKKILSSADTTIVTGMPYNSNPNIVVSNSNYTPQRITGTINVSATDSGDYIMGYNDPVNGVVNDNFVDIFAPGWKNYQYGVNTTVYLKAAGNISNQSYLTDAGGISNAAPLVSGVAAMYMESNPFAHSFQVRNAIISNATTGVIIGNLNGAPNRLLYEPFGMPVTTNAANYRRDIAVPDGLVSLFGVFVSSPTRVTFENDLGNEIAGTVLYSSTSQVNLLVPASLPLNTGYYRNTLTMRLYNGNTLVGQGAPLVLKVDPGLFSISSNGTGIASGQLQKVNKANPSQQTYENLIGAGNVLNPTTEDAYLVLYGTAIRLRSSLASVTATIGGTSVPVVYAGAQGGYLGLDQINIGPLPVSLKGVGLVNINISVEGKAANIVQVKLL